MLSVGDYLKLASGLIPQADSHALSLLPELGWRLIESKKKADAAVLVGGGAPMAKGEKWPANRRGVPLTFVAVIQPATLPDLPAHWPVADWKHEGLVLRVFADLLDDPYEAEEVTILTASVDTPL